MATQAKNKSVISDGLNDQFTSTNDNTATDASNNVALQVVYSTVVGETENTDVQTQPISQENNPETETPAASEETVSSDVEAIVETSPEQELPISETDNEIQAPDAGTEDTASNEAATPADEVVDTQSHNQTYSLVMTNVAFPESVIVDGEVPDTVEADADPIVSDSPDTVSEDTTGSTEVEDQGAVASPVTIQTYSCVFTMVNFNFSATLISQGDLNLNASEPSQRIDVELAIFEHKQPNLDINNEVIALGVAIPIISVDSYF